MEEINYILFAIGTFMAIGCGILLFHVLAKAYRFRRLPKAVLKRLNRGDDPVSTVTELAEKLKESCNHKVHQYPHKRTTSLTMYICGRSFCFTRQGEEQWEILWRNKVPKTATIKKPSLAEV